MAKRQVFFSFHYNKDSWRASQVRNMGKVHEGSTFSDNDWEEVKKKSEDDIKSWIDDQLQKRSCLIVLIGEKTANRKWINYEIKKAFSLNKGIVGVYINRLKNEQGEQSEEGANPFDCVDIKGKKISKYVKCFKSSYSTSKNVYEDIENNIEKLIEYGLDNKPNTWE